MLIAYTVLANQISN